MEDRKKQEDGGDNGGRVVEHCQKSQGCQERRVYCWPALPIDAEKFYFIGTLAEECPYKTSYGGLYTCSCPLRHEIYRKYKI